MIRIRITTAKYSCQVTHIISFFFNIAMIRLWGNNLSIACQLLGVQMINLSLTQGCNNNFEIIHFCHLPFCNTLTLGWAAPVTSTNFCEHTTHLFIWRYIPGGICSWLNFKSENRKGFPGLINIINYKPIELWKKINKSRPTKPLINLHRGEEDDWDDWDDRADDSQWSAP